MGALPAAWGELGSTCSPRCSCRAEGGSSAKGPIQVTDGIPQFCLRPLWHSWWSGFVKRCLLLTVAPSVPTGERPVPAAGSSWHVHTHPQSCRFRAWQSPGAFVNRARTTAHWGQSLCSLATPPGQCLSPHCPTSCRDPTWAWCLRCTPAGDGGEGVVPGQPSSLELYMDPGAGTGWWCFVLA